MKIYLDNAASTPVAEEVISELSGLMRSHYGNPSSIHQQGRDARALVEMSRKQIANFIGAQASEIVFTSGGTEADNLAIYSAIHNFKIEHIITSELEHSAVYNTVKESGVEVHWLKFNNKGEIDTDHLRTLLQAIKGKVLVSLMHVNNELGTLLPLKEVSQLCTDFGAYFHSDTVQSIGHLPINLKEVQIDFITCSAHKIHGLKGTGFLYVNKRNKISGQIHGGGQERDLRSGTENVTGIVSMAKALSICKIEEEAQYTQVLKDRLYKGLQEIYGNELLLNGSYEKSTPYVLNVCLPARNSASMLLFNLDLEGIAVSGGSACSSGSHKSSRVLSAIGINDSLPAIRFSFSRYNTIEEVDLVLEKLRRIY